MVGRPAGREVDASQQLARELVRQKKLTAHQAKEIYAGRSKAVDCILQAACGLQYAQEHGVATTLNPLRIANSGLF